VKPLALAGDARVVAACQAFAATENATDFLDTLRAIRDLHKAAGSPPN
jgi:hypothetical protein